MPFLHWLSQPKSVTWPKFSYENWILRLYFTYLYFFQHPRTSQSRDRVTWLGSQLAEGSFSNSQKIGTLAERSKAPGLGVIRLNIKSLVSQDARVRISQVSIFFASPFFCPISVRWWWALLTAWRNSLNPVLLLAQMGLGDLSFLKWSFDVHWYWPCRTMLDTKSR